MKKFIFIFSLFLINQTYSKMDSEIEKINRAVKNFNKAIGSIKFNSNASAKLTVVTQCNSGTLSPRGILLGSIDNPNYKAPAPSGFTGGPLKECGVYLVAETTAESAS